MIGQKFIGYMEHSSPQMLEQKTVNVGKGGCTVFSRMIEERCGFGFQGLPWCTTFVFAVHPSWNRLGPPCAGVRELAKRMRKYGLWRGRRYAPKEGDIVFIRTGVLIGHCGIVLRSDGKEVISIDGNTVDPSGTIPKRKGGAVAIRRRNRASLKIAGYAEVKG